MNLTSPSKPNAADHLSPEEVLQIIDYIADCNPIIVGGQSINIWAEYYADFDADMASMGPFTSKDVDFFVNKQAVDQLAEQLTDSVVYLPKSNDFSTPNAAVVVGNLGKRRIEVDFMATVLGVDGDAIRNRFVAIEGIIPSSGKTVKLCLMNPLDCVLSRLANINHLKRYDDHSIRQAQASIRILGHFIHDLIGISEARTAQDLLRDLEFVIRDDHYARASHLRFGDRLNLIGILERFLSDERLDERWRTKTLQPAVERMRDKFARFAARRAALEAGRSRL